MVHPDDHWARHLAHPLPLGAALVLAVNDHLLKGSGYLPGLVTGKLSDVAGLFFFPVLLSALLLGSSRWIRHPIDPRRAGWMAALGTAAGFTLLKLSPPFNAVVETVWGPNRLDPSDLWCLPMVALAWLWMSRARVFSIRDWMRVTAVLATAFATMATSRVGELERRQAAVGSWISGGGRETGCAFIEVARAASGSEQAWVELVLTTRRAGTCRVEIERAELDLPLRTRVAASLPEPFDLRANAPRRVELYFLEDGRVWEVWQEPALVLAVVAGSRSGEVRFPLRAVPGP